MQSAEIRRRFLEYFAQLEHVILPGSSLIPEEPSLLLTTAGMVQFIPFFRGEAVPEHCRMATVQRCLRTTDIDKIGHSARHLTFFEMLGNFSVGDYYKKEVIPWAWDFITKELKMDAAHLWVSIFLDDDEAFDVWHKNVGLPEDRIIRLGEEENFWAMGLTGPCGPCSEIHYDFGEDKACGPDCRVGCDCDRFLEIWNLVFMQYNRDESGELHPLPKKNIDTGMGLERVASIMQGVETNFESDLLRALIDKAAGLCGVPYKQSEHEDISLKIIADHSRAVTFLINDGVLPGNEGRGYVLRRLLRRAVRHGRLLGISRPFMVDLTEGVIELMGEAYPDVKKNKRSIKDIVKGEEARFLDTLKAGLVLLDDFLEDAATAGADILDAEKAFKLYDTYGFPLELTVEISEERGVSVDQEGFARLMEKQKIMARGATDELNDNGDQRVYSTIIEENVKCEFVGYGESRTDATIIAVIAKGKRKKKAKAGEEVEIVLDRTTFYAEMGGQVGDSGGLDTETGQVVINRAFPAASGLTVHQGKILKGEISAGQTAVVQIDSERRFAIKRNHTATHLLHWALRMALGEHVRQGGSHVDEHRLRFDFTHGQALSTEEIERIEIMVNRKVLEDNSVRAYTTTYKYATESGALAFFGEKYGKNVRVLEIGDFSRELCGGTHVAKAGEIGQIKIISEASIGANLRRIEAVTGLGALDRARETEGILRHVETSLRTGRNGVAARIEHLLDQTKVKEKELERLKAKQVNADLMKLIEEADMADGVKLIFKNLPGKRMDELRLMVDEIRNRSEAVAIGLGSVVGDSASLVIAFTKGMESQGLDAKAIIKEVAPHIGGGGGGRVDLAQAGGKKTAGIDKSLKAARNAVTERLG